MDDKNNQNLTNFQQQIDPNMVSPVYPPASPVYPQTNNSGYPQGTQVYPQQQPQPISVAGSPEVPSFSEVKMQPEVTAEPLKPIEKANEQIENIKQPEQAPEQRKQEEAVATEFEDPYKVYGYTPSPSIVNIKKAFNVLSGSANDAKTWLLVFLERLREMRLQNQPS